MAKRVFEINGNAFDTLEGFFDEVERNVLHAAYWGRNLNAFNDVLRGGFGTPEDGFVLRWLNAERSRIALGYSATIRTWEDQLRRCDPSSIDFILAALESARRGEGETLFETLVRSFDDMARAERRPPTGSS